MDSQVRPYADAQVLDYVETAGGAGFMFNPLSGSGGC